MCGRACKPHRYSEEQFRPTPKTPYIGWGDCHLGIVATGPAVAANRQLRSRPPVDRMDRQASVGKQSMMRNFSRFHLPMVHHKIDPCRAKYLVFAVLELMRQK